jgi:hypothetical protein
MAALAADIAAVFDPRYPIGLQQKPGTADTYYRGGVAHKVLATGLIILTPAAVDYYFGVVMEKRVAATSDLVWCATAGHWFFLCAQITSAQESLTLAMAAATLFDNPADLVISVAGTAGAVGVIDNATATGVSGWVYTDRRNTTENL